MVDRVSKALYIACVYRVNNKKTPEVGPKCCKKKYLSQVLARQGFRDAIQLQGKQILRAKN
jgi:hypothetical protein